ncbi:MAG: hypothetical protein M3Q58_07655 [Bacteroidota bacterium]|nr:hypothetical protein [Bacteroidota bacterium]
MFSLIVKRILIVIFILNAFSCKKEKDELKPVLMLDSPYEDQVFNVFDLIPISGRVEDDSKIEFLRISLVNEEQKAVAPAIIIKPDENIYNFNEGIILDDTGLKSGTFYLILTAYDGVNEKKLFRKILIVESPRKKLGVFVITSDGQSTKAEIIDSLGQVNFHTSFTGDYVGSSVSSYYQTLTVCGYRTGNINCINLKDKTIKWTVPSTNQSYPTFTNLAYLNNLNYVSYFNGIIKAHGDNSLINVSFNSYDGFYPEDLLVIDDHLVSYQKSFSTPNKKLVAYNKNTGFFYHDLNVNYEVIDFCEKDGKEVLIFGNFENNGLLKIYNSEENGQWEPVAMPIGKISCAKKLDQSTYMFSNNNGLYTYRYMPNGVLLFKAGDFSKFIYDDLNSQIIAVENNQVNYYNYPTGTLINSYSFSGNIKDIHIWYNK